MWAFHNYICKRAQMYQMRERQTINGCSIYCKGPWNTYIPQTTLPQLIIFAILMQINFSCTEAEDTNGLFDKLRYHIIIKFATVCPSVLPSICPSVCLLAGLRWYFLSHYSEKIQQSRDLSNLDPFRFSASFTS